MLHYINITKSLQTDMHLSYFEDIQNILNTTQYFYYYYYYLPIENFMPVITVFKLDYLFSAKKDLKCICIICVRMYNVLFINVLKIPHFPSSFYPFMLL